MTPEAIIKPEEIHDPFNPDYAFIAKPSSSWRISQNNEISACDTIYITTADTAILQSRFVNKNKDYEFNWSGSLQDLNLKGSFARVGYAREGNFIVDMEAKANQGDTSITNRFYIIVTDAGISHNIEKASVYPNPANNFVYPYYDEETIKSPIISCVDILGKEFKIDRLEANKFDTSTLINGLYFIRVKNGNYEKIIKINVIH